MENSRSSKIKYICHKCGAELSEENCRAEGVPYCIFCESESFEEFEKANGTHLALYLNCARFNVPLHPLLLGKDFEQEENRWFAYIELLEENGKHLVNERPASFADGESRLLRIFGKDFTEKDFAKYIHYEKDRLSKLPGTEKQREMWGTRTLWQNLPMTTEVYDELDRIYEARTSRYKGVSLDDTVREVLKKVSTLSLVQEHLRSLGDAAGYDRVQKIIDSMLASEQLRRKDEKPVEPLKMDAMVVALESMGLMENGQLLNYDELVEVLRDKFVKSKKYAYSLDVADQMILDIHNTMRANADIAALVDLPAEMELVDEYGEFESEETEQEKENKRFAGLTKVQFEKPAPAPTTKKSKGGKK